MPPSETVKILSVCGGAVAFLVFLGNTSGYSPKTKAMKNIEDRYSSGGGSKDHLPGAATPRGKADLVDGRNEGRGGLADPAFKANIAEQQLGAAVATQKKPPGRT